MASAPPQRPEGFDPSRDDESRAGTVITIAAVFASLSTLFTCVRVYTRARILRIFCPDDVAIICAQAISIIVSVLTGLETKYGLGRHTWTISPSSSIIQLNILFGVVLGYNFGINVVKIGFLLLYLRVFSNTALKTVTKWVLGYVIIWTIVQVIILAVACMPIAAIVPGMQGKCLPTYTVWLTSSIMSTVTDFVIFALPLPSVLKLKMRPKQKIITVFMFSLGFFTCIVSIIRILTLKTAVSDKDPTWDNVGPGSWSVVELNCAILCNNLPTLRPLVVRYFPTFGLSTSPAGTSDNYRRYGRSWAPTTAKSSGTRVGSRIEDVEAGEAGDRDSVDPAKAVAKCFSAKGHREGNEVELMESDGLGKILVTTDMTVESDETPERVVRHRQSFSWDESTLSGHEPGRI